MEASSLKCQECCHATPNPKIHHPITPAMHSPLTLLLVRQDWRHHYARVSLSLLRRCSAVFISAAEGTFAPSFGWDKMCLAALWLIPG